MDMIMQSNGDVVDIEKLREAYNKAVEEKQDQFMFNDLPLLTMYVKYLLEYIDSQIKTP
jgi:hypothetical protein